MDVIKKEEIYSVRITEVILEDRILLIGAPGIGKTEVVKQKAEEEAKKLNKIFVDLREADDELIQQIFENPSKYYVFIRVVAPHVFPEDLGIPKMINHSTKDYVEFVPPKVLRVLSIPEIHGVLFIDEITNVQRDDQISMYYSIILEKEAGFQLRLSRNIKIICVGNPPEWSEIVRPLPKPLRNRMILLYVSPPTIEEWIKYMNERYNDGWEKLIGAYLKVYPEDFIKPPVNDWDNFPTPRSWTQLAIKLYGLRDKVSDDLMGSIVFGSVGREVGTRVLALLRTKVDVKRIVNELKKNPEVFKELDLNQKILVLNTISQMTIDKIKELDRFIRWLNINDREMLVLTVLLMERKKRAEFIMTYKDVMNEVIRKMTEYLI